MTSGRVGSKDKRKFKDFDTDHSFRLYLTEDISYLIGVESYVDTENGGQRLKTLYVTR